MSIFVISYCVKIIHIEDTPEISKIFSDILTTKNHDFDSASDGRKGLELVVANNYDLILLDMCMPNYSGMDFLLDLKDRRSSEIKKVVVISALELDRYQRNFLMNLGVSSIHKKPISVQNLISQIEQHVA